MNHSALRKWFKKKRPDLPPASEAMIEVKMVWTGQGFSSTVQGVRIDAKKVAACLRDKKTKEAHIVLLDSLSNEGLPYYSSSQIFCTFGIGPILKNQYGMFARLLGTTTQAMSEYSSSDGCIYCKSENPREGRYASCAPYPLSFSVPTSHTTCVYLAVRRQLRDRRIWYPAQTKLNPERFNNKLPEPAESPPATQPSECKQKLRRQILGSSLISRIIVFLASSSTLSPTDWGATIFMCCRKKSGFVASFRTP